MKSPVVLAITAHPDDVELMMSGTLLLLQQRAGAVLHIWTLANGCCGTNRLPAAAIARIRLAESQAAAALIGATYHEPLFDDLAVFYDQPSLARVSAGLRSVQPDIVLTHAPNDYMEDHTNTCRLAVMAAFARGMINQITEPPVPAFEKPAALYHAPPFSLRDPLCQPVQPHFYIDITDLMERKRQMLACHRSQKEWLDVSQGLDAYLSAMSDNCRRMGELSQRFAYAEAWFRHNPLGFCGPDYHPLRDLLKEKYHGTTVE